MTLDGAAVATPLEGEGIGQKIARGPVAAIVADQAARHQRRRLLRGQQRSSLRESESSWSNFLECCSILLFPMAMVVMFGRMLGNHAARGHHLRRHAGACSSALIGWAIYWDRCSPIPLSSSTEGQLGRRPHFRTAAGQGLAVKSDVAALPVDQRTGQSRRQRAALRHFGGPDLGGDRPPAPRTAPSTACTTASTRWPG